ncbi:MAG: hypothetical protein ACXU8N_18350 [Telluria sp.]
MTALERLLIRILTMLALLAGVVLSVRAYGTHQYRAGEQAGQQAVLSQQAKDYAEALVKRGLENSAKASQQTQNNLDITKEKDDEIADLHRRLAAAGRLRVGAAVCPDRSAAPTNPESAASSDDANPPGGVVSAAADRDLKQLIADVETDLATGRACQAFLQKNNLVP